MEKEIFSIDVGRAALRMAMSETRDDEDRLKANYAKEGFRTAAVNFGGEFLPSVTKIVNVPWWRPNGSISSQTVTSGLELWQVLPMKP